MATPTSTKPAAPEAADTAAPAKPQFIAVAFVPEAREPMLQEIMGGSFGVSMPATDERLVLHPGTNKVDLALWKRCREVPAVQEAVAHRVIVEIELGDTDGGAPDSSALFSIKQVEQTAALQLVSFARSITQLESWHDTDDRMVVRSTIKRRIEALNTGAER